MATKDKVTTIRINAPLARKIEKAARAKNVTSSAWMRQAFFEKLQREMTPGDRELARERAMNQEQEK